MQSLAPAYPLDQKLKQNKLRLSTRDLQLKVESKKLAPRFIGPFPIQQIINLRVPKAVRIHPTVHESRIKPISTSDNSARPSGDLRRQKGGISTIVSTGRERPEKRSWVNQLITQVH